MKKKRLPIEQLRAVGKIARDMLVKRGIIAEDSILDALANDKTAPFLPGIPHYLPHRWTIKASQRMMYDIIVMWKGECKGNKKRTEDITEFFKFVIKELRAQERIFKKEEKKMSNDIKKLKEVPYLKDVFSPIQKKETIRAMQRFFVDSFAVSVVLKSNETTTDYANWFLDWTEQMLILWDKSQEEKPKQIEEKSPNAAY